MNLSEYYDIRLRRFSLFVAFESISNGESIVTLIGAIVVSIVVPIMETLRKNKNVSYKEIGEIIKSGIKEVVNSQNKPKARSKKKK